MSAYNSGREPVTFYSLEKVVTIPERYLEKFGDPTAKGDSPFGDDIPTNIKPDTKPAPEVQKKSALPVLMISSGAILIVLLGTFLLFKRKKAK